MKVTLGHTDRHPLQVDIDTLIDTRQVITASSGGGKSFLLRRLIELIAKQVQVIVIDPEGEFNKVLMKYGRTSMYNILNKGERAKVLEAPRRALSTEPVARRWACCILA